MNYLLQFKAVMMQNYHVIMITPRLKEIKAMPEMHLTNALVRKMVNHCKIPWGLEKKRILIRFAGCRIPTGVSFSRDHP